MSYEKPDQEMSFKTLLLANTLGSGAVLIVAKFATFLFVVSGSEGRTPFFKTMAKLIWCMGWDVVGAGLVGLAISLIAWPLIRRKKWFWIISGLLQVAHGFFVWISYIVNKTVGAPLGKAAIDLTWRNSDDSPGAAGFSLGSSVLQNINIQNVVVFVLMLCGMFLLLWSIPRYWSKRRKILGRVLSGLAVVFVLITIGLLPHLRNGQILGIRVHTYSMERSAVTYLLGSYIRPVVNRFVSKEIYKGDPFRFDMSSVVAPDEKLPTVFSSVIPGKSNLVVVILESVGAVDYSVHPESMPHLHSLGDTGVEFLTHYSTWPQTMKALFSFYCSELPYPDYRSITRINPSIPCTSLPRALKNEGYSTALIVSDDFSYDRQLRFFKHRGFDAMMDRSNQPGAAKAWNDSWGVSENLTVENVLGWIDTHRNKPFAVFYNMVAGHHPYSFDGFESKIGTLEQEHDSYLKCLGYIDERISQVVEGLKNRNLLENTLVVVFSDHGEGFGRHPRTYSHGPVTYEEVIRVPLVIAGPQLSSIAGTKVRFPTSHIDLAPTILGLMGLKVPFTMKGRNLVASRDKRFVVFGGRPPEAQVGLRDGKWKFIFTRDTGLKELFDLSADPEESKNLADDFPLLTNSFYKKLMQWQVFSKELIEEYQSILQRELEKKQSTH